MSIAASYLVAVNPGVIATGGDAIDINGMVLTNSTYVPINTVQSFSSADDVSTFFGSASTEYSFAQIYFKGFYGSTTTPSALYFAQYPAAAVAAYLRSASLSLTVAQLQQLSAGAMTLTVDGSGVTSADIDLSTAASFSAAAQLIETGFSSKVSVAYDSTKNAFVLSSATTGANASIGYASGDLATSLCLTEATSAVLSQGADAATPSDFLSSLIALNQSWVTFTTTWEPDSDVKVAFSAWVDGENNRYAYVCYDSDVNVLVSGSTDTAGYAIGTTYDYSGTVLIYGDISHAAFEMGMAAATNYSKANGRITHAYKYLSSGLTSSVTTKADAEACEANGYNYYGEFATANETFNAFFPGSITGEFLWADAYYAQIWLNANLQYALISLFRAYTRVPFTAAGYALIESSILSVVNEAITVGVIDLGTVLSQTQIEEIQSMVGSDVSSTIQSQGYYLYIDEVTAQTASTRSNRTALSIYFFYADGGAIQKITLNSYEVQ